MIKEIKSYWRAFNCDPDPRLVKYSRQIDNAIAGACLVILAALFVWAVIGHLTYGV